MFNEEYKNEVVNFFTALGKLAEAFNDAIENYSNEEYDKVETPDEEIPADECPSEECDCICEECECADKCYCNDNVADDCNQGGPAGPREEYDSYKITVCDYNVKSYEEALEIMEPKLNALTFAMRTFTFGEAALEFRFSNVVYKFVWSKDNDAFIGLEDSTVITKEVFWDEIDGQIKELTDENLEAYNKQNAKGVEEAPETPSSDVTGNECIYKHSSFYPYGKKCENCPEKDKCYTPETEAADETESHSATYDADGNAIADEEIPTLKDYTGERKTVDVEPPVETEYTEITKAPEEKEEQFTGKALYEKLNSNYTPVEKALISAAIQGVYNILSENLYDIDEFSDGKIVSIKFSLDLIVANIPNCVSPSLKDTVNLSTLANEIRRRYEFAEVIIKNDIVHCYLV